MEKIRLVISAYTSNSGGGRTGALSLLRAVPEDVDVYAFIDQRLGIPSSLPPNVQLKRIAPSIPARLRAEWDMRNLAMDPGTVVLKMGSVPPLFHLRAKTFVFFENRYLLKGEPLRGQSLWGKARLLTERFLCKIFRKNAGCFLVQAQTVAEDLIRSLGPATPVQVIPFQASTAGRVGPAEKNIDFIYPATADPHKNHSQLLQAWQQLAEEGLKPSLCLTIDSAIYPELSREIERLKAAHDLKLINVGFCNETQLAEYYGRSKALIFPSRTETFGRPLLEARAAGIAVLAPELDYVRDVLDPEITFDPSSPKSIARAVKRHLKIEVRRPAVLSPQRFLDELRRQATNSTSR